MSGQLSACAMTDADPIRTRRETAPSRIPVAILGATGTVGQKLVARLADHPWFEVVALAASAGSAGRRYGEVVRWRETTRLPEPIARLIVEPAEPGVAFELVFSALDGAIAGPIEESFARSGALVVTNAKSFRMDPDIPLVIPEINPGHLALLNGQRSQRNWSGGIVANPNCSTAALALALAPLHRAFGVAGVVTSTMQALSGAGYPGISGLDALGNVIPFIPEEEEKIERESRKILGQLVDGVLQPASFRVSSHANRVPVLDGHLETVSVALATKPARDEIIEVLSGFRGAAESRELPSTPKHPIEVDPRPDRPQSRLDVDRGDGMTITVGRVRPCPVLDWRFVVLGHNLVRGAAGAAVQNAELLVKTGVVGE